MSGSRRVSVSSGLMTVLTFVSWLLHLSLVMPSQDSDLPPKEQEKMAEFQVRYSSVILYAILSFSGVIENNRSLSMSLVLCVLPFVTDLQNC